MNDKEWFSTSLSRDAHVVEFLGGPRDGQRTQVGELYDHYVIAYAAERVPDLHTLGNLPPTNWKWTYRKTDRITGDGIATIYALERESATY